MTSETFGSNLSFNFIMFKDEINEFLTSLFGSEETLCKCICNYLTGDIRLPDVKNALPKQLWEYLQRNITSRFETDKLGLFLCMLKRKIKDNQRQLQEQQSEDDSQQNESSEIYYIKELESIFINCLEDCLLQIEKINERIERFEVKPETSCEEMENESVDSCLVPLSQSPGEAVSRSTIAELLFQLKLVKHSFFIILSYCDIELFSKELETLLTHIIKITHEKKYLSLITLYLTLLCGSKEMLHKFSSLEVSLSKYSNLSLCILEEKSFNNISHWRSLFLYSVDNKKHLAVVFYEKMIENFSINLPSNLALNSKWCLPLLLLTYIHHWTSSEDKLSSLPLLQSVFSDYGDESDPFIRALCSQKIKHMMLTHWCSKYRPSINVHKLLTLLQNHSSLYAIQASLPLSCLPYQGFLELLLKDSQVDDSTGRINKACVATYQSYSVLLTAFHIIMSGIEMDKVVSAWRERKIQGRGFQWNGSCGNFDIEDNDLNTCKTYYKTHIVKKWYNVKRILSETQPLEYRLEILEDLFSLLFIKHTDLSDEGHDDSWVDESNQASPVSLKPDKEEAFSISSFISSSSRSHIVSFKMMKSSLKGPAVKPEKMITFKGLGWPPREDTLNTGSNTGTVKLKGTDSSEKLPQIPSPDSSCSHDPRESSCPPLKLLTGMNSDLSSSSSVGDFSSCGYIINTLVAWDLLLLLKDSLVKLQAEILSEVGIDEVNSSCILSSISRAEFFDRFNSLEHRVKDSLWRMKIALPHLRELGSDELMGDFMRGTLYSSMSSVVYYELETRDPDADLSKENAQKKKGKLSLTLKPVQVYRKQESITNFLLSSPKDLLSIALMNDNLKAGQDIISKYDLGGSKERQELVLMQCLKENIPKIEEISRMKSKEGAKKVNIEGTPRSAVKKIKSEMQSSSHDVAISALIDQALNLSMLENVDEEEQDVELGEAPWIKICPKLVLLDIALTSSIIEENASKLFTLAFSQELNISSSSAPKSSSIPFIHEYFEKLPQLTRLNQVIESVKNKPKKSILKEGNMNILKVLLPKTINPANLLLSKCPLNKEDFENSQSTWVKLLTCISSLKSESLKPIREGSSHHEKSSECDFQSAFSCILALLNNSKLCKSIFTPSKNVEGYPFEYLSNFVNYLQMLKTITNKHIPSSSSPKTCFEVLEQRPNAILGDLIFDKKIDPYQLEMEFQYIDLDMLSVIVRYVSYPYLVVRHLREVSIVENVAPTLDSLGCLYTDGVYVMNANNLICTKPVHGDLVVSDILSSLLDNLRDFDFENPDLQLSLTGSDNYLHMKNPQVKTLLLECSELCCIDMTKLTDEYEALVFFINLANLMFVHAVLLNSLIYEESENGIGLFSKSKMEQIIAMKRVGYLVGKFGFISLYDVVFRILRQPMICDKNSVSSSTVLSLIQRASYPSEIPSDLNLNMLPEPLLIFIICQGLSPSPKIGIFYSDTFKEELNTAISDYFMQVILPDLHDNFRSLEINPVLFTFLSTYSLGWDEAVNALKVILGDSEDSLIPMYLDWLKKINVRKSNLRVDFTLKKVLIEYAGLPDAVSEFQSSEDLSQTEEPSSEPITLPSLCSAYINDNCPILNTLLQVYHLAVEEDDSCNNEGKVIGKNEPDTHFLSNLFSICKIYHSNIPCITNNFEKSKIFASLPFDDYYLSIMSTIEDILSSIPQEDFLRGNVNATKSILKIADILSDLPSIVCHNHFVLSYSWDSIMAYLSSIDVSAVLPTPWSFVFQIRNPSLRFQAMQDNFIKWPVGVALRSLHFLDCEGNLTPSQKGFVHATINQMQIYEEIMKLPKVHLCLETCRDVLQASTKTPQELMTYLIHQRQFSLALRWVKAHGLTEKFYLQAIKTSLLQCLDVVDPNFKKAESILDSVSSIKLENVVNDLLANVNVHSTRKFVMSYFLKRNEQDTTIAATNLGALRQELMGLILIEDVAPKIFSRSQLFSLILKPNLILEQWIMNLKLDAVEKALPLISSVLGSTQCFNNEGKLGENPESLSDAPDDCLCWDHYHSMIEKYAFRALEISGIQVTLKHSFKAATDNNQFVIPPQVPLHSEWQKNSSVNTCPVCQTAIFSLFCRRHHCRRCGRVVCASCSMNRLKVQGYGGFPVRVCQDCYDNLSHRPSHPSQSISVVRAATTDGAESQTFSEGVSSNSEVGWYFSTEPYHNQRVREEFSFDYAPSLSLCQAVLALHRDDNRAALCIMKLSHKMFRMAVDSFSADFSEVDPSFVLQIIQTLVSSAKVRFGKLWSHSGISLCEYYMQWVSFLQLLLKSRCVTLLPPGTLDNMLDVELLQRMQLSGEMVEPMKIQQKLEQERRFLRILRDNLVKKEMWDLALDISTKAGFETSGVWGAFAMASLKAGDFAMAREHFSKVLTKPRDKNVTTKSAVLEEIVSYLESPSFGFHCGSPYRKASLSEGLSGASSNPTMITQTLTNLVGFTREISRSDICTLDRILPPPSAVSYCLSSLQQRECEYYLRLYGSHRAFLQFLVRHNRTRSAVIYARESDVDAKLFTDEILLPSFRKSCFNRVWIDILDVDRKQTWSPSIVYLSCKYLERSQHLHCLLEVQKALSDRLRSAMTLIRLYMRDADSFSELVHRTHYLTEAASHLQSYLDVIPLNEHRKTRTQRTPKRLSHICLHSTSWHVNRQINLSSFQKDVTKYLADLENSGVTFKPLIETVRKVIHSIRKPFSGESASKRTEESPGSEKFQVPTVFSKEDRLVVSVVVMCTEENVSKNLSLVYRLVETNAINPKELLSITLQTLVVNRKTEEVGTILESILEWGLIPGSQVKNVVWPAVISARDDVPDKVVRDIAKFLTTPRDKMELFMEAGLLKLAYSQVNEKGSKEDIERLKERASQRGDRTVAFYCTKWLQNYSKKQTKKTQPPPRLHRK